MVRLFGCIDTELWRTNLFIQYFCLNIVVNDNVALKVVNQECELKSAICNSLLG